MATALSDRAALAALGDLDSESSETRRIGFVGVALDTEIGERLIEGLAIPEGAREGAIMEMLEELTGRRRGGAG